MESAKRIVTPLENLFDSICSCVEGIDGLETSRGSVDIDVYGKHLENKKEYLNDYTDDDFFAVGEISLSTLNIDFNGSKIEFVMNNQYQKRLNWVIEIIINGVVSNEFSISHPYSIIPNDDERSQFNCVYIQSLGGNYVLSSESVMAGFLRSILLSEPFSFDS